MTKYFLIFITGLMAAISGCASETSEKANDNALNKSNVSAQETVKLSGKTIYNQCRACHTIDKGKDAVIGPNLWGIVGSDIAAKSDFTYSAALSAKEGVWDEAALDAFIESPKAFVPGNRMTFAGIKDADKRAALIKYLKQQSD